MMYISLLLARKIFGFEIPIEEETIIRFLQSRHHQSHHLYIIGSDNQNTNIQSDCQSSPSSEQSIQIKDRKQKFDRAAWIREQILSLIREYKNHRTYFKSSTMKNEKVWQMISGILTHHTAEQRNNKFKYLITNYMAKIDNMSNKQTGAGRVLFEYFDEFDEIFGKEPNVIPLAIASSKRGLSKIPLETDESAIDKEYDHSSDKEKFESSKKRKRSQLEKQLEQNEKNINLKEERSERQHQDKLARQDMAISALNRIADSLEKYVGKNKSVNDDEV